MKFVFYLIFLSFNFNSCQSGLVTRSRRKLLDRLALSCGCRFRQADWSVIMQVGLCREQKDRKNLALPVVVVVHIAISVSLIGTVWKAIGSGGMIASRSLGRRLFPHFEWGPNENYTRNAQRLVFFTVCFFRLHICEWTSSGRYIFSFSRLRSLSSVSFPLFTAECTERGCVPPVH